MDIEDRERLGAMRETLKKIGDGVPGRRGPLIKLIP